MAVQLKAKQTIRGEVEQVNEKGVRIAGVWWNFSRYHAVPQPYRDEVVELTVTEGSNWIETLRVLEDSKGCAVLHQPEPTTPGTHTAAVVATQPSSSRDAMIARQVALKAAVAYCAAREAAKAADILPLAASFEAWLARPFGEAE